MTTITSPFLTPTTLAANNSLASLYIRRDSSLPILLSTTATSPSATGYAEGNVTNTRFGSFPHSTIINAPWGSQIRASNVDTGSRGRGKQGKKRKASTLEVGNHDPNVDNDDEIEVKEAVAATSGFIHILPPTPENWTYSLPHRTQVVYTPDYSYILHRIRARPGARLLESGSGSGSFTHAAARAVFNGYPSPTHQTENLGHVFTYEYHETRYHKLHAELQSHGLSSIVTPHHRDVYKEGFLTSPPTSTSTSPSASASVSPNATSIFLDLPAPWEALPHLTRTNTKDQPSVLDPSSPIHISTFSPCIEQVQRTVSSLRRHNWTDIDVVEVSYKRIEVRKEYTGYEYDGMRGVNAVARDVDEAVRKLVEVEKRASEFHAGRVEGEGEGVVEVDDHLRKQNDNEKPQDKNKNKSKTVKQVRVENTQRDAPKLLPNSGRLVSRPEPELKTHTSYLVFAVLPREWSEEDEERQREVWNKGDAVKVNGGAEVPKSQRQLKKEAKGRKKLKIREEARRGDTGGGGEAGAREENGDKIVNGEGGTREVQSEGEGEEKKE